MEKALPREWEAVETVNPTTAEFRKKMREAELGPLYIGQAHFGFAFVFTAMVAGLCIFFSDSITPWEWITVPLTFLYANVAEYLGHRRVMHRLFPALRYIYDRHAGMHHIFFTHEDRTCENPKDYLFILFPPYLLFFFFGTFALPVGVGIHFLISTNVACLFVATAVLYYLNYEILHLCYHLPDHSWVHRIPGMKFLRHHHTTHHDPKLMNRLNFNITYPICDRVFGTLKS